MIKLIEIALRIVMVKEMQELLLKIIKDVALIYIMRVAIINAQEKQR